MLTLQAYERAGFSAFEMTMLEDFESSLKNQAAHRQPEECVCQLWPGQ